MNEILSFLKKCNEIVLSKNKFFSSDRDIFVYDKEYLSSTNIFFLESALSSFRKSSDREYLLDLECYCNEILEDIETKEFLEVDEEFVCLISKIKNIARHLLLPQSKTEKKFYTTRLDSYFSQIVKKFVPFIRRVSFS